MTTTTAPATGHRATFMDTTTGRVYSRVLMTELEAVQYLGSAALYDNLAPLRCDPEPDWTQYEHGPATRDAITAARTAHPRAAHQADTRDDRT